MPISYFCPKPLQALKTGSFSAVLMFTLFLQAQQQIQVKPAFPDDLRFRIAFWNLENYMDTLNDAGRDGDFTPQGSMAWNTRKFKSKSANLAKVIHAMKPDILGVAEVENQDVLRALISDDSLKQIPYGIVHYESPDLRGIDVALLYNRNKMFVAKSFNYRVVLESGSSTRDILYVRMIFKTKRDTVHFFVNHWPSRRDGVEASNDKRIAAAKQLRFLIDSLNVAEKQVVIMGDFNDEPWDESLTKYLGVNKKSDALLVNLSYSLPDSAMGTTNWSGRWNRFDQIIISQTLNDHTGTPRLKYHHGSYEIFHQPWMSEGGVKYGAPLRGYSGNVWQNGYSDHFPVRAELRYE